MRGEVMGMPAGQWVDLIQTAGIVFICLLIAYCIWRLERALNRGADVVRNVLESQSSLQQTIERLAERVENVERQAGLTANVENYRSMRRLADAIQDWIKANKKPGERE